MEDFGILVGLLIVGMVILLFVAFPIYTLARLEILAGQIRELQWRWSQLSAGTPSSAPRSEMPAVSAPPLYSPTPTAAPVSPPPRMEPEPVAMPSSAPEPAAPVSAPAVKMPDLETLLGANWLARLGIAAIAAAAAFFLQYAFRSGWIGPPAQVGIGLIAALLLLGTAQFLLPKPRYRNYAQALASGGIVVYFLSIYAAYSFYEPRLIGYGTAFGALAIGALAASALAIRNRTEAVAVLCLLGAFAAPALIRQEGAGAVSADSLMRLYAYLAALNVWVAILMRLRSWHSLTVVSFLSTWILFFFAGPLAAAGWRIEAFAALYLLISCYMGARALYAPSEAPPQTAEPDAPQTLSQTVGLALITGGCLAFSLASLAILSEAGILGLPDYTLAGIFVALLFAGLAIALPRLPNRDREARLLFGAFSAITLAVMMLLSLNTTLPREQVPAAFAFTQVSYLLFLGVALILNRREEEKAAAAILAGVNAFLNLMMTCRVLDGYFLWGAPAASLALPLSAAVTLCAVWIATRQREEPITFAATLAISTLLLTLGGLLAAPSAETHTPLRMATAIYAGEFLLVSLLWIALRRQVAWSSLRADIVAAIVNAALFFGMMAESLGTASYRGFTLLCGAALAMAAYHAILGGALPRREEPLHRLTYLGLAVTFLTIAIPLQLKAGYITLAWAVEAVVLLWTGFAARELRVRWFALSLLTLAAARALFFDLPNLTEPIRLLLNERMLGGAAVVAGVCVTAWMLWKNREKLPSEERILPAALAAAANVFALLFISVDLWDYVGMRWSGAGQANAPQLALSLFWTLYALAAISVGIWRRVRPVRLFAIALLYLSILKVFLFDLSWLEQPYRIVSFFTLGVILLLVSLLYTRFEERLRDDEGAPPASPEGGATPAGHPAG